jgi:hypothetical protein
MPARPGRGLPRRGPPCLLVRAGLSREAERPLLKRLGPEVGRQDDDRIREVGQAPRGIGQPSLAQNLQEQVE